MPELSGNDIDPNDPKRRQPPEAELSLRDAESALAFVVGSPDGEAKSESEFGAKLNEAIEKATPENEVLNAMTKHA